MKKYFIVGKILLASSIILPIFGGSLSVGPQKVSALEQFTQEDAEQLTKQFIDVSKDADWDTALTLVSPSLKKVLSKEKLSQMWMTFTGPYGEIEKSTLKTITNDGVHTKVSWLISTNVSQYELVFKMDSENLVNDFRSEISYPDGTFLMPAYDRENYTEKQVVIGEGEYLLPGVLTVPEGDGPFPAVVLVHGSGANDMDSTFYYAKPFRDLAVGLANEGIAVLRYDKRTKTHGIRTSLESHFSIQEETVIDANKAVELLKSQSEVDVENIFVLGHSQGAFALPLIVENDTEHDIKGIIGAAGLAGKFQDLLLWQVEQQLERAKQMNAPVEQLSTIEEQLQFLQGQFRILNDSQYSLDNVPKEFQMQPASWWFDIRDYVPTTLIKEQAVPYLILHGEKDIQVPMSEFEKLKSELQNRENTQFKTYPNMFHTLVNYAGNPDGMTEYLTPGNVSEEFIMDIAAWVKTGKVRESSKIDPSFYKDYQEGLYWSEAIKWALNEKIIFGYGDEKVLKPNQPITESQYLRMLFRYTLGDSLKNESIKSIYALANKEELSVTGKTNAILTRSDAALLLAQNFASKEITKKEAVQWLYDNNIVQGYVDKQGEPSKTYESFQPDMNISRAHLVTILYNLHQSGIISKM